MSQETVPCFTAFSLRQIQYKLEKRGVYDGSEYDFLSKLAKTLPQIFKVLRITHILNIFRFQDLDIGL